MATTGEFLDQFDADGRYGGPDGSIPVVSIAGTARRRPGTLSFRDGLCVRAEFEDGHPWANADGSPLRGVRFLLYFDGDRSLTILVDGGRIVDYRETTYPLTRAEFLKNIATARNLFAHPRPAGVLDPAADAERLASGAVWLATKSVSGYNPAHFPELGAEGRQRLQAAIDDFRQVAEQVPRDGRPTPDQYLQGATIFASLLDQLRLYLGVPHEAEQVEAAIRAVDFPFWVVNWDFELDEDRDGDPLVWVWMFVEKGAPRVEFVRFSQRASREIQSALVARGIGRSPYIRMRTTLEHRTIR